MNIELYIGDRLCDIGNPEDLGIYLKRVFIKPSELSVKDAQKSYEISLPATAANNEIFNYTNIEEVQGKFKVYDKARLHIDGILILDGKFRMSQITRDAYIGNLGVPAPKTVKDIFGETMMNQAGKWPLPFNGVEGLTAYNTNGYNTDLYGEQSPCLFPFVLYGLLNKYEPNKNYSNKDVYDSSVRFALNDFLPSVNVVHMLKKIFENANYTLGGSTLSDERFKNMYVSYKNPAEYELFWGAGEMKVKGSWHNILERNKVNSQSGKFNLSVVNMFRSSTINNLKITDSGSNITKTETNGTTTTLFKVPYTGLYKLEFDAKLTITEESNNLNGNKVEVKVVRYSDAESLGKEKFDNSFFDDNQPNSSDQEGAVYPEEGAVNFVDPKQNSKFICGFSWGFDNDIPNNINPASTKRHNPMAISGGKSWNDDSDDSTTERSYSAVYSPGYAKRIGSGFTYRTEKFNVNLIVPDNKKPRTTQATDNRSGTGYLSQVIWLEKDETISIISVSRSEFLQLFPTGIRPIYHSIDFELSLTPFMHKRNWLTVADDGGSSSPMNWNDPATFTENEIDLIKFLPSNIKVNEWIDNFCKTFNLEIINTGTTNFDLNIKKNKLATNSSLLIDLDRKANVTQRTNESLNLPYMYEFNFTADTAEEGYYETMEEKDGEKVVNSGENGGGQYYTGSGETTKLSQNSSFSYCWYKKLTEDGTNFEVPVITDHEIWENIDEYDYEEMSKKFYPDKNQRFWYKSGIKDIRINNEKSAKVAMVTNEYKGQTNLILDYKNESDSIMKNFFLILMNNNSDHTIVESYLSPEEYSNLDKALVKFNGDLYYTAEVDGYDPLGKKKCRLKLIRKII